MATSDNGAVNTSTTSSSGGTSNTGGSTATSNTGSSTATSNTGGSTATSNTGGSTATSNTGGSTATSNTSGAGDGGMGGSTSGSTDGGTGGTAACPCEWEGSCHEVGAVHPGNPCLVCGGTEPTWLSADGTACDDGLFCNGADFCSDGECAEHPEAPCGDDEIFCNGTESCNEDDDACQHSGDPCGDDGLFCNGTESCNDDDDACQHSGSPCGDDEIFCNGTESCDEDGDSCTHSGNPCGDNGAYCDGPEVCVEEDSRCASEGYPCGELACIERPVASCCQAGAGCRCVLHVDQATGSDAAGGTTWGTALETIGEALSRAAQHECEVWVATGVYSPGPSRNDTLEIPAGVALYGGFSGDEELASERDADAFLTIISGELGDPNDATDNTRSLLRGGDETTLDGFTIERAYNENVSVGRGAGLSVDGVTMSISNCTFKDNVSRRYTAAIYALQSNLEIRNCRFINNNAEDRSWEDMDWTGGVGAVFLSNTIGVIDQSEFIGNKGSTTSGVAFWISGGGTITNCLFQDNKQTAVSFTSSDPVTIRNSRFMGNSSGAFEGRSATAGGADVLIDSCLFEANQGWDGVVDWLASLNTLTVASSVFLNNVGRDVNGGLYTIGPVKLINSSFAGHTTEYPSDGDVVGISLLASGFRAVVDITNSVFWNDEGPEIGLEDLTGNGDPTVTVSYSDIKGGFAGVGNIDTPPLWDAALRPSAASPLIDAAHPSEFPEFDIDGNARFDSPVRDVSIADMGAYEYLGD